METQNVFSKTVKKIGFKNGKLEVHFHTGSIYQYDDVPYEIFERLRIAPSIGEALCKLIIKEKYVYKRIS